LGQFWDTKLSANHQLKGGVEMATLEKRGDYWRVKIRRKGFPIQTRSFDTKTNPQRWARDIETEMDKGSFLDRTESEKNTLRDVLFRYIDEVTPLKRGASAEAPRLRAMMLRPIAELKIAALSSMHIAKYRDDRLKEVAGATVNKELNLIAHALETARREWGIHIPENPVRLVRRPQGAKPRERRLVGDEPQRLLAACADARNPFLLPIVNLAIETAMRQAEIVGMDWKHVDLKKCIAFLPETKNGETRGVPLSTTAVATIRTLPLATTGKLFPGVTTEAIKRAFMRACERAEMENFHFHDLRHEATSRLFEKGLNPLEVASITGHKTLQMLRRYTHLRAEDLARKLG
jgi:integrase